MRPPSSPAIIIGVFLLSAIGLGLAQAPRPAGSAPKRVPALEMRDPRPGGLPAAHGGIGLPGLSGLSADRAMGRDTLTPSATEWSGFLEIRQITSDHAFAIAPGHSDRISFEIRNSAGIAALGIGRWRLASPDGRIAAHGQVPMMIAAGKTTGIPIIIDAKGLRRGPYSVILTMSIGGRPVLKAGHDIAVAGPEDLYLIFDHDPKAKGLSFDHTAIGPVQVTVNGVSTWCWEAGYGSAHGGDGWWHSLMVKIDDDHFRHGHRPVVDVDVTFRQVPDAPVSLMADTATGSRQVAGGWGRSQDWQTMHCELDDARFAETPSAIDPKQLPANGCDLRFNACTGNAQVRSIWVRGYHLVHDPDWRRMLRFDGVDTGRDICLYAPGESPIMHLKLQNLARIPLDATATVTLSDDQQASLWSRNMPVQIPAAGPFAIPVTIETKGLKQGVYTVHLSLSAKVKGASEEMLNQTINFMISEQSPIAKAKPGEFLYGLDSGVGCDDPRFLHWMDFMGVDILRNPGVASDVADLKRAYAIYDAHHLKTMISFGPAWNSDPAKRRADNAGTCALVQDLIHHFHDHMHYFELGNEPDLTGFYPGPMSAYIESYTALARAIKSAEPDACVMNGGLCFFGKDGDRRAREFIDDVDPTVVDAFAYHGHGPGSGAERAAYERIHAAVQKVGKLPGKLFIETESGFSARSASQLRIQARTAVEKLVYAQSVGLPTFMWFRLLIGGGDGDYTNLVNAAEPRPVVLSYRTTVRNLRGLSYASRVDLGIPDSEAYLFRQHGGDREALVAWCDGQGGGTRTLSLAGHVGMLSAVSSSDLFGNVTVLPATGTTVSLPIGADPIFLTWRSRDTTYGVQVLATPIVIDPVVELDPSGHDGIPLRIANHGTSPLVATVHVRVQPGITPSINDLPVAVDPGKTLDVLIPVDVKAHADAVAWPQHWTVYTDVPPGTIDPSTTTSIPDHLTSGSHILLPHLVTLRDDRIDFALIAGHLHEKAEAWAFSHLDLARASTVRIGASSDWWMAWSIDGKAVMDTLSTGNGSGFHLTDHPFSVSLAAGRHLMAVRVQSGSQGWKLFCGGPTELALDAAGSGVGAAGLDIALVQGSAEIAHEHAAISFRHAVMPMDTALGAPLTASTGIFDHMAADGEIGEGEVVNDFVKFPDSSKWWKGPADLSGRVWIRGDTTNLQVVVAVRDDINVPSAGPAGIDVGDAIRIAFTSPQGTLVGLGIPANGDGVYRRDGPPGSGPWLRLPPTQARCVVNREESSKVTWYRLEISRQLLPGRRLGVDVLANDNDWGVHKQYATWAPGFDAPPAGRSGWYQVVLP